MMPLSEPKQDHQALLETSLHALGLPMSYNSTSPMHKMLRDRVSRLSNFCWPCVRQKWQIEKPKGPSLAIKRAKFPFLKEMTDYNFTAVENISKTSFLELAQGGYLSRAENLILVGNPGLGKTHLAIGLALCACRQAKRVRFYKTATLINDLQVAQKKLTLSSFVAHFVKLDLLVLDELGFITVDKVGGQLLFQLVSDLYEKVSMIITSNLRFSDWNSIFADATLTTAFLDRLTHKGRIIEFVGESYRYHHRLQESEAQGA
jgi:DNA replication protein DnaC